MNTAKAFLLTSAMPMTAASGPVLAADSPTDCRRLNGAPGENGQTGTTACPQGGDGGSGIDGRARADGKNGQGR